MAFAASKVHLALQGENRCQCELPPALPIAPRSTYPGDSRFGVGVKVTAPAGHRGGELKVPDKQEDTQNMVGCDQLVALVTAEVSAVEAHQPQVADEAGLGAFTGGGQAIWAAAGATPGRRCTPNNG